MENPVAFVVAPLWGVIAYCTVAFRPRVPATSGPVQPGPQSLNIESAIDERIDRELNGGGMDRALWTLGASKPGHDRPQYASGGNSTAIRVLSAPYTDAD
jgi:hypothetical protein